MMNQIYHIRTIKAKMRAETEFEPLPPLRHAGTSDPQFGSAGRLLCRFSFTLLTALLFSIAPNGFGQRVFKQAEVGIIDLLEDVPSREFFQGSLPGFPLSDDFPTREEDRLMPPETIDTVDEALAERTQTALTAAQQLIRREEWRRAQLVLNDALAINPDNIHLLHFSALVSAQLRDYSLADHYYKRVLSIDPSHLDALAGYARVLLHTFRIPQAESIIDQGMKIAPDYLRLKFYRLMISVINEDRYVDDPFWDQLLFSHIQTMLRWVLADKEIITSLMGPRPFQRFCERVFGEGTTEHLSDMALSMQQYHESKRGEQWDDALEHLHTLRNFGLEGIGIEMEMAIIDFDSGRKNEGVDRMQRLAQRNPNNETIWFNYALMQLQKGAYQSAVSAIDNALRRQNNMPHARFAKALALANLGQEDEAWLILFDLAREHPRLMIGWLDHQADYMQVIRRNVRYRMLSLQIGIPIHNL